MVTSTKNMSKTRVITQAVGDCTDAMDKVMDWLKEEGAALEDCDPVRDYGISMFKIGLALGLNGVTYDEFNKAGNKLRGYDKE